EGGGQVVPGWAVTIRCGGRGADDLVAGRHEIGLQQVVDHAHAAAADIRRPRRSARAEIGDGIVATGNRIVIVDRAHGNDGRVVARGADGTIDLLAEDRLAEVA